jgi:hypothetical protein
MMKSVAESSSGLRGTTSPYPTVVIVIRMKYIEYRYATIQLSMVRLVS